jgi:hypothetical protein
MGDKKSGKIEYCHHHTLTHTLKREGHTHNKTRTKSISDESLSHTHSLSLSNQMNEGKGRMNDKKEEAHSPLSRCQNEIPLFNPISPKREKGRKERGGDLQRG